MRGLILLWRWGSYRLTIKLPPAIGIDGILGLEFDVPEYPILLSIDMKPAYDFTGGFGSSWQEGALTVRHVIGR